MRYLYRYSKAHFPIVVHGIFAILCIIIVLPIVLLALLLGAAQTADTNDGTIHEDGDD